VKGKGYPPAENHPSGYHNMPFSEEEYRTALEMFGGEA
jgi:deoxyxylulose-5-phosphate synthase